MEPPGVIQIKTPAILHLLLVLLLAANNQSECFSLSNDVSGNHLSRNDNHDAVVGHPALLDAISSFSPHNTIDACRIFHGRGGLYLHAEHLALDYYPPVFLVTSFREELCKEELEIYGDALHEIWNDGELPPNLDLSSEEDVQGEDSNESNNPTIQSQQTLTWVYQCRGQRGNTTTCLMSGHIPQPHIVTENNGHNKYIVHLAKGQNHGLFLDMAAGRTWLQSKCQSGEVQSVLNLFAYTCAFSVAALNGGANTVVNIDMSHGALKIGQRNHDLNNGSHNAKKRAKFLGHDLFKSWGKLKRLGPYDCVVVDPPSYQKGSFVASKDYGKVIRRLPSLLNVNGWALLCLNAPELDCEWLLEQVRDGCGDLHFVERLENPKEFKTSFPERELKVLAFQYRPTLDLEEE